MSNEASADAPRRVAMLIYPGVAPLDVAGPLQVFGIANHLTRRPLYEVMTVAPTPEAVPTRLGFSFLATCEMAALPFPIDTLLVSGGGGPEAGTQPEIAAWLKSAAPHTRRYGSICTGAFALGAAGLVEGKRVTTHWAFCEEFARRNPTARTEVEPIFIRDGNLYTSAGITAGIDLALALLEEDHGRDLAMSVARYLVLFLKRSGGQAQFSTQLMAQFSHVPAIRRTQSWCLENLEKKISTATLAKIAVMSERTFYRTFRDDTGQTPNAFIASARLQAASRFLEETQMTQKEIVRACGLGSVTALRRLFALRLGVTPAQYRDAFSIRSASPLH